MATQRTVSEPGRERLALYDVDVAIAGAGLCSTFAAIASGRLGARTLLIDRMPTVGGNIGSAGLILGGGLDEEGESTLPTGRAGITKEFLGRVEALRASGLRASEDDGTQSAFTTSGRAVYCEDANICSYVALRMLEEAGVEVLLSAYASDPIVEDGRVRGLFVECKGGRRAVLAKVTVDGTGDADLAQRAGAAIAPYLQIDAGEGVDERYKREDVPAGMIRDGYMRKEYPTYYNDTMLLCLVGNVDAAKAEAFAANPAPPTPEEQAVIDEHMPHIAKPFQKALAREWLDGGYSIWPDVGDNIKLSIAMHRQFDYGRGLRAFWITLRGPLDPSDPVQLTRLEVRLRRIAFETVRFLQSHIPGFEHAYLVGTQPFLGFRGGARIEGEHTLTVEEMFAATRFDDVLYLNVHEALNHGGAPGGFDVPLSCTIPKGLDGLLVCGRGAAYERRGHDPSGMRARPSMMVFGQCVGTAAAVAALDGASPKVVDIRKVQQRLVDDGIVLGDAERLRELGLTPVEA